MGCTVTLDTTVDVGSVPRRDELMLQQLDTMLSEHVMALHTTGYKAQQQQMWSQRSRSDSMLSSFSTDEPLR